LADNTQYIVEPPGRHNRAAFHCGDEHLDRYFVERASRDLRENISAVFVLVASNSPDIVLGYYTLSSREIDAGDIPDELKKRTGRYQRIGATLLGRLAVAKEHQRKGLGELLLLDALRKSVESTKRVVAFAVVVDFKYDHVVPFYRKYGFIPLHGNRLFIPMRTVRKLLEERKSEQARSVSISRN
jgi:predicted N-acetyltransferase YhbS